MLLRHRLRSDDGDVDLASLERGEGTDNFPAFRTNAGVNPAFVQRDTPDQNAALPFNADKLFRAPLGGLSFREREQSEKQRTLARDSGS